MSRKHDPKLASEDTCRELAEALSAYAAIGTTIVPYSVSCLIARYRKECEVPLRKREDRDRDLFDALRLCAHEKAYGVLTFNGVLADRIFQLMFEEVVD